jgi:hypothetical protein
MNREEAFEVVVGFVVITFLFAGAALWLSILTAAQ